MSADDLPVTPDGIEAAAERIGSRVRRTPVIQHGGLTLELASGWWSSQVEPPPTQR
jgi:hypothetical protein